MFSYLYLYTSSLSSTWFLVSTGFQIIIADFQKSHWKLCLKTLENWPLLKLLAWWQPNTLWLSHANLEKKYHWPNRCGFSNVKLDITQLGGGEAGIWPFSIYHPNKAWCSVLVWIWGCLFLKLELDMFMSDVCLALQSKCELHRRHHTCSQILFFIQSIHYTGHFFPIYRASDSSWRRNFQELWMKIHLLPFDCLRFSVCVKQNYYI